MATVEKTYSPDVDWNCEFLLLETKSPPAILDITGATFRSMIRRSLQSDTVLIELSTTMGNITQVPISVTIGEDDLTGNGIMLSLTAVETLALYQQSKGCPVYGDIEMSLPSQPPKPKTVEFKLTPCTAITREYDYLPEG